MPSLILIVPFISYYSYYIILTVYAVIYYPILYPWNSLFHPFLLCIIVLFTMHTITVFQYFSFLFNVPYLSSLQLQTSLPPILCTSYPLYLYLLKTQPLPNAVYTSTVFYGTSIMISIFYLWPLTSNSTWCFYCAVLYLIITLLLSYLL